MADDTGTPSPWPAPPPFRPSPGPPSAPVGPEQYLVGVGDIGCSQHWAVTPSGTFPLAGSTWTVTHQVTWTERIPTRAIVLAVIFFVFCLLGLLFLLMKERTVQGYITVTMQCPGGYHATQIPISSQAEIADIEARVHYIRSLAAAARP